MYRTPWLVTKLLPWPMWRGPHKEEVYLTFDDGPDPDGTRLLLDLLAAQRCLATFFVVGQRVEAYPELVQEIVRAGHGLGTHSYDHARPGVLSAKAIRQDLLRTDQVVADVVGEAPRCFRPPYGSLSPALVKVASSCGKEIVLWSLSTGDYRPHVDAEQLARWLVRKVRGGDIVLLHDGSPHARRTAQAVRLFLPQLPALGLRPAPLPQALL